ncbi:MAG: HlyD family efflux transporter periplasmic adaptor subunit [Alphaproteobacteria bacterium]|nr:HlyD family efflux transporter periplasmic adaptor subunit [Alphaproteobacteria bacterium]
MNESFFISIGRFFISSKGVVVILFIIGGIWGWVAMTKNIDTQTLYTLTAPEVRQIQDGIEISGAVVPDVSVDIKPLSTAQVVKVNITQGQKVKKNQVLVVLDQKNALQSLNQAKNNYESIQAQYNKFLKRNLTETDKRILEEDLKQSEIVLAQGHTSAIEKIKSLFIESQKIIEDTNIYFSNIYTPFVYFTGNKVSFQENIFINNINNIQSNLVELRKKLVTEIARISPIILTSTTNTYAQSFKEYETFLNIQKEYFGHFHVLATQYAFDQTSPQTLALISQMQSGLSQTQSMQTNIITTDQLLTQTKTSYTQKQLMYQQKTEEPTKEDHTIQAALVENSRLNYIQAQNNYNNTIILAPFDGVISSVNAKIGEAGTGNIASIIGLKKIVKVFINENDISSIMLGQKVTIAVDALHGKEFEGKISAIDPIGVSTQGVVTYPVTIEFDNIIDEVKINMSVSTKIIIRDFGEALSVPISAIKKKDGVDYVLVVPHYLNSQISRTGVVLTSDPIPTHVITGNQNSEYIEIISGIDENTVIVQKITTGTASVAPQKNIFNAIGVQGGSQNRSAGGPRF